MPDKNKSLAVILLTFKEEFHIAVLDSGTAFTNQYLWAYYGYFSGTDDDF